MKSTETKTEETLTLAERWEQHPPPVPSDTRDLAIRSLDAGVSVFLDGERIEKGLCTVYSVHAELGERLV